MLIFKLLLLPVRHIGKDFRCSPWILCLLSNPFHPKNTWYTYVTCYADFAVFYKRYSATTRYLRKMVVCYVLASLSVNIDFDWLLRICAKFLLIKNKMNIMNAPVLTVTNTTQATTSECLIRGTQRQFSENICYVPWAIPTKKFQFYSTPNRICAMYDNFIFWINLGYRETADLPLP